MSEYFNPNAEEFCAAARKHFAFLVDRFGFVVDGAHGSANPFYVRFRGPSVCVVVEGVSYGVVCSTRLERKSVKGALDERLDLRKLAEFRRPDLEEPKNPAVRGQLTQMAFDASVLPLVAADFLGGNFGEWQALHDRAVADNKRAMEASAARDHKHDIDAVCAKAAEAFRSGQYDRVIELLAPIESELSSAQLLKLKMARAKR
ncbi:MAG TPA: hypothetical protein VMF52_20375 [Steroidobacteraceae bacterium]|nr:hypothetical protein [Steroidobacteraceae bacterium]